MGMADPDYLVSELVLSARRFVSVWSECACSRTSVAFILNRVAAPSMDGELVVMAGIKVVAQWWRPFGSHPSGAGLWLSGFQESVEVCVSVVQGKGKGKTVVFSLVFHKEVLSPSGVVFDPGGSRA